MMTKPGVAREVPAGRLAAFEEADDEPTPLLPPRPRATAAAPSTALPPRLQTPGSEPAPATTTAMNRIRPSNVHVPVQLLTLVEQECANTGLSRGELIIVAIEATADKLPDLIRPAARAGGSLFAARSSKVNRPTAGPGTPLHYRMLEDDFRTLDELVETFRATSRGHLITVALTTYLATPNR
jgi:hypothetical protein